MWFAVAWGSFPLLTGLCGGRGDRHARGRRRSRLRGAPQPRAAPPFDSRTDGAKARAEVSGTLELDDGERLPVTSELLLRGPEQALRALTAATIALAVALVLLRV